MNVIDMLYDENNEENIVLYDENDKACEFEQLALIPYGEYDYAILLPVTEVEGVGEDEVMIFRIEGEGADAELKLEFDEDKLEEIFDMFNKLMSEDEE